MTEPRVLVVEDDRPLRSALDVALRRSGYVVHAMADGNDLSGVLERFRPDLALLDVRLGDGPDGLAVARRIRSQSDLPILMLTAAARVEDRLAGFDAGTDDYVVKPFAMPELLARVAALLRRSGRLDSSVIAVGDLVLDLGTRDVTVDDTPVQLTPTEFDILAELARRRGTTVSKPRLLAAVWGFEDDDPNLVEVHVSSLRRKLEAVAPRIVHTVRGAGYLIRG